MKFVCLELILSYRLLQVVTMLLVLIGTNADAQTWDPLKDEERLRAMFMDTVLTVQYKDGVTGISRYNADGTGTLEAWGDSFERGWKIENSQACILIDGSFDCLDIEKNPAADNEFRATSSATGETATFSVDAGEATSTPSSDPQTGSAGEPSADELAAKLSNPTSPIMTLGNNIDFVFFDGDLPGAGSESSVRYVFQSVFPFKLSDGGTAFFRPAIPVMFNEPVPNGQGGFSSVGTDIADIGYDLSYGKTTAAGLLWGGGVAGTLPTASDDRLGKDKWGLGPEILIGKMGKWGVVGTLLSHQWDIAGSGNADINQTSLNYFYAFPLGGGYQVAAGPTITYDHTKADDKLTLPLGIGIAKTQMLGGRPWKFQVQYWNYVKRADAFAPEHQIRLSVSPVVSAPWNED